MGATKAINLTKVAVEGLVSTDAVYFVSDLTRGLYLQVTPTGAKTWVLRYRQHGRSNKYAIGRWPELPVARAREMAIKLLGDLAEGVDPQAKRKAERASKTVRELAERFEAEHIPLKRPSTQRLYQLALTKYIVPALGHLRAKDVDPSDVAAMLAKIRTENPIMSNRVRAVTSKLFAKGSIWGFCPPGHNPAQGQDRAPERKKDRHLSDAELGLVGQALRNLEGQGDREAMAALRIYLLTGLRKSELIGDRKRDPKTRALIELAPALRWSDVDFDEEVIRLQQHKTSDKAGGRVVPLSKAVLAVLKGLKARVEGNPYIIPGRDEGQPLLNISKPWARVQSEVIAIQERQGVEHPAAIDDVTLHDLRRSFASLGARMGYPLPFLAGLLGHAAGGVTATYARVGTDPLREATEAIGARMVELMGDAGKNFQGGKGRKSTGSQSSTTRVKARTR